MVFPFIEEYLFNKIIEKRVNLSWLGEIVDGYYRSSISEQLEMYNRIIDREFQKLTIREFALLRKFVKQDLPRDEKGRFVKRS